MKPPASFVNQTGSAATSQTEDCLRNFGEPAHATVDAASEIVGVPGLFPIVSMEELQRRHCVITWIDALGDEIAVILIKGKVIVRSSVCPHFGGEFRFNDRSATLECKWHGWKFDAETGQCRNYRIGTKLRAYESQVIDGIIFAKCG